MSRALAGDIRAAALMAGLCAAVDVWVARADAPHGAGSLAVVWAASFGVITLLAGAQLSARRLLRTALAWRLGRAWALRVATGVEGLLVGCLVASANSGLLYPPRNTLAAALTPVVLLAGIWVGQRHRGWRFPLAAVLLIAGAGALVVLGIRERAMLRLAVLVLMVPPCAALLGGLEALAIRRAPALARWRRDGTALALLGAAALAATSAHHLAERSEPVRRAVRGPTTFLPPAVWPVDDVLDRDGDGTASFLGRRDCDGTRAAVHPGASERLADGVDQNCDGDDGFAPASPTRARSAGTARGADVLVVSLDGWRFDLAAEVPRAREALGPHAEFALAVSPSSRTADTFAALWRGRAVRGLATRDAHGKTTVLGDPPPATLATALRAHGYRCLFPQSHRYLAAETHIPAGFEVLAPPSLAPTGSGQLLRGHRFVPMDELFGAVEHAARGESAPVFAWVHVMETHAPYRHDAGAGPSSMAGLRRALRHSDQAVAAFIERWRHARARPLVVAMFGDHGEEFGEHGGRFHSTTAYAEQVRVPLWIAGPGVAEARVAAPASLSSLPATLAELVGAEAPATFTEPSLLACLEEARSCPAVAVSEVENTGVTSYTFETHRLVEDPRHATLRLFDVARDAYDQRDLAAEAPGLVERLRPVAHRWNEQH